MSSGLDPTGLAGRVAIVTGGASGIGLATSRTFCSLGASVAVVDVDGAAAAKAADELASVGYPTRSYVTDLAELSSLTDLVAGVEADHGDVVSILVNNAGVAGPPLLETTLDDWHRVLTINLTAAFVLVQTVGRRLLAAQRGGSIVNVSSSSAFRAVSSRGAYGVSKAGLGALTRAAAWELGPSGVNVNAVAPGVTRTPMTAGAFADDAALDAAVIAGPLANLLRRVSEPEDIANVIAFLCLPASRQITGQVIHVSAGAVV